MDAVLVIATTYYGHIKVPVTGYMSFGLFTLALTTVLWSHSLGTSFQKRQPDLQQRFWKSPEPEKVIKREAGVAQKKDA